MPTAPQPVWHWPPAIMSLKDLTDAMRAGFSLSVIYTDRGNALYRLSRGAIVAPIGILKQVVGASRVDERHVRPWRAAARRLALPSR
jgi:hypothetical protein